MQSFAEAVQRVDATGVPVVEGLAVRLKQDSDAEATVSQTQGQLVGWTAKAPTAEGWRVFEAPGVVPLGEGWSLVRQIRSVPGVAGVEPLLLSRQWVADAAGAQRRFSLWGRVSDERLAQIRAASKEVHWSLVSLGVCGDSGKGGAWAIWRQRHGDSARPGDGIVVAHPDTGYTAHQRLLPHLVPRRNAPNRFGWSFVEPGQDALDPLEPSGLPHNPGHGTATASVIAAGTSTAEHPWGVAPGAKILPLRVSTSVIHLSFLKLIEALDKALAEGAHVVSMSLGGPHDSGVLEAQIRKLLDAGIIVVAAAGNHVPTVMFPARLPGVIACAASNAINGPWRFSGLGREVLVTAPGELVWHDDSVLDTARRPRHSVDCGSGTSYSTAHVAGLAALWLSYHGRDWLIENHCDGNPALLPFLFRYCVERSADSEPKFLDGGKAGFGKGIACAEALLRCRLLKASTLRRKRQELFARRTDSLVDFPPRNWWTVLTLPTFAAGGTAVPPKGDRTGSLQAFLRNLVPGLDPADRAEIGALVAADLDLAIALSRRIESGSGFSERAMRRYLLRKSELDKGLLSSALTEKLRRAQEFDHKTWLSQHPELGEGAVSPRSTATEGDPMYEPKVRRLRAFAFDPSLATRFDEVGENEITIPVVFERELLPGPVGDYLEVVDVDPASDCVYAPVDLDHPHLLAQDGLPRSEGNPQFHQQMVYAVAMKTIGHFEEALGRPIFWSPLRPWDEASGDGDRAVNPDGSPNVSDQFVRRLRLYPHALREQNAYYSPQKRAILFGYFPAGDGDSGAEMPGGVVFTCLAHDIIAHEVTHAILDGMHVRFVEPTNPDVLAFHEAFADLVALLQRFTYTDLVRTQIARVRGRLGAGTLLTRLGLQFGQTTGRGQALRDALGIALRQRRRRADTEWRDKPGEEEPDGGAPPARLADSVRNLSDEERREVWQRFEADPTLLEKIEEPHERGSFLVAAVFDAYIRIYEARVADLQRIATGGTGVLPEGDLHPDLVARMAEEASKAAAHVLRMCIRAMDYVPPIDITFGEFLRALITADADLVPDDRRRYRVAFTEAFRKWGIYPRDVRTLSEESLRWSPLEGGIKLASETHFHEKLAKVGKALLAWAPGKSRRTIFEGILQSQKRLHKFFKHEMSPGVREEVLNGIDTEESFHVTNLRPARRIGPRGEFRTEMVVEVIQTKRVGDDDELGRRPPFRGGVTLIVSLEDGDYRVRYAIYKRADSANREARQREFQLRAGGHGSGGAAEYSSAGLAPGWWSQQGREAWLEGRTSRLDDMRASSCGCRRDAMLAAEDKKRKKSFELGQREGGAEPFALLHRT